MSNSRSVSLVFTQFLIWQSQTSLYNSHYPPLLLLLILIIIIVTIISIDHLGVLCTAQQRSNKRCKPLCLRSSQAHGPGLYLSVIHPI